MVYNIYYLYPTAGIIFVFILVFIFYESLPAVEFIRRRRRKEKGTSFVRSTLFLFFAL